MRLGDGRLYVGHTSQLSRRHAEHAHGKGCRTSERFGAGELLYAEAYPDRVSAARREKQLKGWSREKKLALAAGHLNRLHALSVRRQP